MNFKYRFQCCFKQYLTIFRTLHITVPAPPQHANTTDKKKTPPRLATPPTSARPLLSSSISYSHSIHIPAVLNIVYLCSIYLSSCTATHSRSCAPPLHSAAYHCPALAHTVQLGGRKERETESETELQRSTTCHLRLAPHGSNGTVAARLVGPSLSVFVCPRMGMMLSLSVVAKNCV